MKTILIIEDEAAVAQGIAEGLRAEHFDVVTAGTGERGLLLARRESVELILLDLMLPDMNGEDVCRQIRQAGIATPIMMLTSKREEMDKVMGLELGADDYMTKPFSLRELAARVRALLRRQAPLRKEIDASAFGNVEVDFEKQEVRKARARGAPLRTRDPRPSLPDRARAGGCHARDAAERGLGVRTVPHDPDRRQLCAGPAKET